MQRENQPMLAELLAENRDMIPDRLCYRPRWWRENEPSLAEILAENRDLKLDPPKKARRELREMEQSLRDRRLMKAG